MSKATVASGNDAITRRLMAGGLLVIAPLLLGGCDYFPRDPGHSLDDIRARGTIRVGVARDLPPQATLLLQQLEHATGAKAQFREGGLEPLLQKLEAGDLDLVVAPFAKDTPWVTLSALSPPLRTEGRGDTAIEWRAAMRNGENRWIMLVETNARKIGRADAAP